MIYGIGTDICDIRRIQASLDRHGERFAAKVLSDAEMATWRARSARWPERGVRYLATRFSAKEAFSKAIGLGMRMPMTWRLCEIGKMPSGQPFIVLHGELKAWFEAKSLSAHITVTDESEYAASFCVVEAKTLHGIPAQSAMEPSQDATPTQLGTPQSQVVIPALAGIHSPMNPKG